MNKEIIQVHYLLLKVKTYTEEADIKRFEREIGYFNNAYKGEIEVETLISQKENIPICWGGDNIRQPKIHK